MNIKRIPYTDLKLGDIVHFYGARFEIVNARLCKETEKEIANGMPPEFISSVGKWLDGVEVIGYFGKNIEWHFQGNHRAICTIETNE